MPRGAPVDRSHVDKFVADDPTKRNQYWREILNKSYWDHPFHPLKEQMPIPDYRCLRATSTDLGEPWRLMRRSMVVGVDDHGATLIEAKSLGGRAPKTSTAATFDGAFSLGVGRNPLEKAQISRTLTSSGSAATFGAKLAEIAGEDSRSSLRSSFTASRSRSEATAGWRHARAGQPSGAAAAAGSRTSMPSFARVVGVQP
mmetsp:Transcript_10016/g.22461  ORF Transcript_10016/g.22461 Transcript_10016/m.22461 type:complete len:200 (-) Transcript_10016:32-631(-)